MGFTRFVGLAVAVSAACVATLATGCASHGVASRVPARTAFVHQEAKPSNAAALEKDHCIGGPPRFTEAAPVGPTVRLYRDGYIAEHSSGDKIALWVCSHLTADQMTGDHGRPSTEPFKADPDLASGGKPRAELTDYKGSGYSRGHQSPSADFRKGSEPQKQTYYLSNMTPQWQSLNGGVWAQLEGDVRDWAKSKGSVYVITGPMFWEDDEDDPAKADGYVTYFTIGNGVSVPTHYFKIVVAADASGHPTDMIAFVMPNLEKMPSGSKPGNFISTVKWIEERTGIDFMPEFTDQTQKDLESKRGAMWN